MEDLIRRRARRAAQKARQRALSPIHAGKKDPWEYGAYRVVVTRRVTEEEQISVECYEPARETAIETYRQVMAAMRDAMIEHNERVVMVHKGHLSQLERLIEERSEELRALTEEVEQAKLAQATGEEKDDAVDAG